MCHDTSPLAETVPWPLPAQDGTNTNMSDSNVLKVFMTKGKQENVTSRQTMVASKTHASENLVAQPQAPSSHRRPGRHDGAGSTVSTPPSKNSTASTSPSKMDVNLIGSPSSPSSPGIKYLPASEEPHQERLKPWMRKPKYEYPPLTKCPK
jgi:hypothetical protein